MRSEHYQASLFSGWIYLLIILSVQLNGTTTPSYLMDDETAPVNAVDGPTPINPLNDYFEQVSDEPSIFPAVEGGLANAPQFFRDARIDLNIRSYYRDADSQSTLNRKSEAWALGGNLDFKSGHFRDIFALGIAGYTTQKMYASNAPDSSLLGPGDSGITSLGMAYAELKVDEVKGRFYRQIIDTPFVNRHDNRMIPNTFEAYIVGSRDLRPVEFIIGQVTKMKPKDENQFISIAERLNLGGDTTNGISMAGIVSHFNEDIQGALINYYTWDAYNTVYSELNADIYDQDELTASVQFQFFDQRSVGEELIGAFSLQQFGGSTSIGYNGLVASTAATTVIGADAQTQFGSYAGYTSMIINDFNRKGETAFVIGLSYDFGKLGLYGLSAYTNMSWAWINDSQAITRETRSREFDINIDYRFPEGTIFENLWIRLRGAWLSPNDAPDGTQIPAVNDYRIIVNYDIPLL